MARWRAGSACVSCLVCGKKTLECVGGNDPALPGEPSRAAHAQGDIKGGLTLEIQNLCLMGGRGGGAQPRMQHPPDTPPATQGTAGGGAKKSVEL